MIRRRQQRIILLILFVLLPIVLLLTMTADLSLEEDVALSAGEEAPSGEEAPLTMAETIATTTTEEESPVTVDDVSPTTTMVKPKSEAEEGAQAMASTGSPSNENVVESALPPLGPVTPARAQSDGPTPPTSAMKNNKGEFKKQPTSRKDIATMVGDIQNEVRITFSCGCSCR
jgi:hypothetical protein